MSRKQCAKGERYGEKAFNRKSAYTGKKKKLRQKKKKKIKMPRARHCHLCCRIGSSFNNFQAYILVLQALKAPSENNRY